MNTRIESLVGSKGSKRGFTLIELLIVVAIIGILAAIMFPVFARARENARRSSCQSNLKQIGLGILQYVQDYDETMPRAYYSSDSAGKEGQTTGPTYAVDRYKWMDAIFPYVKSEQLFVCPSAEKDPINNTAAMAGTYSGSGRRYVYRGNVATQQYPMRWGSYVINNAYPGAASNNWQVHGPMARRVSGITAAADTVLAGDGNGAYTFGPASETQSLVIYETDPQVMYAGTGDHERPNGLVQRHLDTLNYLFCDGHVKAERLTDMNDLACIQMRGGGTTSAYRNWINTALTVEVDPLAPAGSCP